MCLSACRNIILKCFLLPYIENKHRQNFPFTNKYFLVNSLACCVVPVVACLHASYTKYKTLLFSGGLTSDRGTSCGIFVCFWSCYAACFCYFLYLADHLTPDSQRQTGVQIVSWLCLTVLRKGRLIAKVNLTIVIQT